MIIIIIIINFIYIYIIIKYKKNKWPIQSIKQILKTTKHHQYPLIQKFIEKTSLIVIQKKTKQLILLMMENLLEKIEFLTEIYMEIVMDS